MCSLGSGDNLLAGNNLLAPSPRTGFSRLPSTVRSASPVTLVVLGRGETGNELNDSIGEQGARHRERDVERGHRP
jgi:hypothetical protein